MQPVAELTSYEPDECDRLCTAIFAALKSSARPVQAKVLEQCLHYLDMEEAYEEYDFEQLKAMQGGDYDERDWETQ